MFKESIKDKFGIDLNEKKITVTDLPVYMIYGRSFYRLKNEDVEFILVEFSKDETVGVKSLKKQYLEYVKHFNNHIVFAFQNVSKAKRDSMTFNKIPFISSNQLYMPFIGISFINNFLNDNVNKEKMMPVTQLLFLYLLYNHDNSDISKTDAATLLNTTKMSITRACQQLSAMDLISLTVEGRTNYISLKHHGKDAFMKARKFMINPVKEIKYTDALIGISDCLKSSVSALSFYSSLNQDNELTIAVSKQIADSLILENNNDLLIDGDEKIKVEIWKYDPLKLSKNGYADIFSLYMSFANDNNERIEEAIDEMLERYEW